MSPGSSTESYPAFARIGLRKTPEKPQPDCDNQIEENRRRWERGTDRRENKVEERKEREEKKGKEQNRNGRTKIPIELSSTPERKHTRIRLYNTLARPMLSYGSEAWTLRKADKCRITAYEMRFMRRTAGYTKWDLKRNCEILKELKTQPVLDYIVQYQSNWKHHLERMSNSRLPKAIYNYVPYGQRSEGRPAKRWRENFM
ncbi:hypothetical protein ANN_02671 [Periplaneta americana]|uniref:Uncharacterized protein n=1 Tax=Periplaneta americana TaxID=6978 RepID=A0ABQ8TWW3_PERAM|nr:hypothetical protein ANN_02671 [Periplaneta americana]